MGAHWQGYTRRNARPPSPPAPELPFLHGAMGRGAGHWREAERVRHGWSRRWAARASPHRLILLAEAGSVDHSAGVGSGRVLMREVWQPDCLGLRAGSVRPQVMRTAGEHREGAWEEPWWSHGQAD